jgi:lipopolysaccharide transport system permease protein
MPRTTTITPRLPISRYFADMKAYGELMFFLAGRDLALRYKQTVAGVLWALLVPLLTVTALSFVFGHVAKLQGSSLLMVYAAMIPWQFFSTGLSTGGMSLLTNTALVTKLYFPRMILPISSLGVALVDMLLNFVLLFAIGAFSGMELSARFLTLPLWIALAFLVSLGPILFVAAALVNYRDLRFLIPFIIQFGLFVTPVGYSVAVVPARLQPFFNLNPLVGLIEGMRWALLNTPQFPTASVITSIIVGAVLLIWGGVVFLNVERTMADEI